jgi:hypothetical protein
MKYMYILDDQKRPVAVDDVYTWGKWIQQYENKRVELTEVDDTYKVSTVFLGTDHSWRDDAEPVLFETMVFSLHDVPGNDLYMQRYCTWDEAVDGHHATVLALATGEMAFSDEVIITAKGPLIEGQRS